MPNDSSTSLVIRKPTFSIQLILMCAKSVNDLFVIEVLFWTIFSYVIAMYRYVYSVVGSFNVIT